MPLFMVVLVPVLALMVLRWAATEFRNRERDKSYQDSSYFQSTDRTYRSVVTDTGSFGEYLTGEQLDRLPGYHRTLYNLYVPKPDGTTTEIDILFLHTSGVYVIESKNYSGYIYGSTNDRQWTAVLAGGHRKERFFNPLRQNQGHIAALTRYLPWLDPNVIHSLIVFSVRCTLAKVPASDSRTMILRRNSLIPLFLTQTMPIALTAAQIDWLFMALQPTTRVDASVMAEHINRVQAIKTNATRRAQRDLNPQPSDP